MPRAGTVGGKVGPRRARWGGAGGCVRCGVCVYVCRVGGVGRESCGWGLGRWQRGIGQEERGSGAGKWGPGRWGLVAEACGVGRVIGREKGREREEVGLGGSLGLGGGERRGEVARRGWPG